MHSEVNEFWPAYFLQRKLTGDKSSWLENAFWGFIFVSEVVLPVYGFLKTYIMLVTHMEDYVTLDDDDDDAVFRNNNEDIMIAQFKQEFHNKCFSLQDQGKCDEKDTLWKLFKFWLNVTYMGVPTPDKVYDYDYNEPGMDYLFTGRDIFRRLL